jgi:3-dehydroquinate synthase
VQVGLVRDLLRRAGLPVVAPRIGAQRARSLMSMDKKVLEGRIRLVLVKQLGKAVLTADYDSKALDETLRRHFGEEAA